MINGELLAIAIVLGVAMGLASVATIILKKRRKPLDVEHFTTKWKSTQKLLGKKDTWPLAIINADKLLDEALKKSGYKGKTMGERLVSAQRDLKDNDATWFAHKLRNKLVHEQDVNLKQADVLDAMSGLRDALRDLGALQR